MPRRVTSRVLARILLAAAFLFATQAALQHPLDHLGKAATHEQHCNACAGLAALGAAPVLHATLHVDSPSSDFASAAYAAAFSAAFTPYFRSQAPPAAL
jgi:hypothetical protein